MLSFTTEERISKLDFSAVSTLTTLKDLVNSRSNFACNHEKIRSHILSLLMKSNCQKISISQDKNIGKVSFSFFDGEYSRAVEQIKQLIVIRPLLLVEKIKFANKSFEVSLRYPTISLNEDIKTKAHLGEKISFSGVVNISDKKYALINNKMYEEGEIIGSWLLEQISNTNEIFISIKNRLSGKVKIVRLTQN